MSLLFPKIEKNENAMAYGQPKGQEGKDLSESSKPKTK